MTLEYVTKMFRACIGDYPAVDQMLAQLRDQGVLVIKGQNGKWRQTFLRVGDDEYDILGD